jgi:hypothetical protein
MSRTVIGFCGPIGCGKSAATRHLINSYRFVKRPFAGPLKDMAAAIGLNDEQLNGSLKETPCDLLGGKTPRYFMQRLGTEFGRREMDDHFWTRLWGMNLPAGRDVVADDVRFPNEVKAIHDAGGMLIQLDREGTGGLVVHASEMQGIRGDIVLQNNGSIDDLYTQLDWCLTNFWREGKVA